MRPVRLIGPALLVAGLVVLAIGFLRNEASLMLVVIFPVVTATGPWSVLGIVLIVAGFFSSFLGFASVAEPSRSGPSEPSEVSPLTPSASAPPRRWGGVLFLGPIPVVFGSDPKLARWMILVGILLFAGLVVLTIIALRGI